MKFHGSVLLAICYYPVNSYEFAPCLQSSGDLLAFAILMACNQHVKLTRIEN